MSYLHRIYIRKYKDHIEKKLNVKQYFYETKISLNKLTNNIFNISLQISTMALQTRVLSKGTAVQVLNEISIEYDFSEPSYIVKSLEKHQKLPPFQAKCEIFKNKITFLYWGTSPSKKSLQSKMQQLKCWKCFLSNILFQKNLQSLPEWKIQKYFYSTIIIIKNSWKSGQMHVQSVSNAVI